MLGTWGIFVALYYAGTFFLGGILRRQWVDYERLLFPLARFPLEVTAGAAGRGLLPEVFRNRAFLCRHRGLRGVRLRAALAAADGGTDRA